MEVTRLRCQRIGCDATFGEDDNPEDSCRYHDSAIKCGYCLDVGASEQLGMPIFHDGMKEWSCCKKRSHDFSLFLEIPGCKMGKHTTEKPVLAKAPPRNPISAPTTVPPSNSSSKESCPRCKQGFFCSDHGSEAKVAVPAKSNANIQGPATTAKKIVNINEPQTCKNPGCCKDFKEKDNHETACSYHPGPAVFHDRMRGWKCCDVHVKEFDEFMSIPPCAKGWHNADPK